MESVFRSCREKKSYFEMELCVLPTLAALGIWLLSFNPDRLWDILRSVTLYFPVFGGAGKSARQNKSLSFCPLWFCTVCCLLPGVGKSVIWASNLMIVQRSNSPGGGERNLFLNLPFMCRIRKITKSNNSEKTLMLMFDL